MSDAACSPIVSEPSVASRSDRPHRSASAPWAGSLRDDLKSCALWIAIPAAVPALAVASGAIALSFRPSLGVDGPEAIPALALTAAPFAAAGMIALGVRCSDRIARGVIALLGAAIMLLPIALGWSFLSHGTEFLALRSASDVVFLASVVTLSGIALGLKTGASRRVAWLLIPALAGLAWWLVAPRMLGGSVDAALLDVHALGARGIALFQMPARCVAAWEASGGDGVGVILALGSTLFAFLCVGVPACAAVAILRCLRGGEPPERLADWAITLTRVLVAITLGMALQETAARTGGGSPMGDAARGDLAWWTSLFNVVVKGAVPYAMALHGATLGIAEMCLSTSVVKYRRSSNISR